VWGKKRTALKEGTTPWRNEMAVCRRNGAGKNLKRSKRGLDWTVYMTEGILGWKCDGEVKK